MKQNLIFITFFIVSAHLLSSASTIKIKSKAPTVNEIETHDYLNIFKADAKKSQEQIKEAENEFLKQKKIAEKKREHLVENVIQERKLEEIKNIAENRLINDIKTNELKEKILIHDINLDQAKDDGKIEPNSEERRPGRNSLKNNLRKNKLRNKSSEEMREMIKEKVHQALEESDKMVEHVLNYIEEEMKEAGVEHAHDFEKKKEMAKKLIKRLQEKKAEIANKVAENMAKMKDLKKIGEAERKELIKTAVQNIKELLKELVEERKEIAKESEDLFMEKKLAEKIEDLRENSQEAQHKIDSLKEKINNQDQVDGHELAKKLNEIKGEDQKQIQNLKNGIQKLDNFKNEVKTNIQNAEKKENAPAQKQ